MAAERMNGKRHSNTHGDARGRGEKKVGELIARFKGKPELSAEQFEGMQAFDDVTGNHDHEQGDYIKEQIVAYHETLMKSEEADLLFDFTLEPSKTLKRVIRSDSASSTTKAKASCI